MFFQHSNLVLRYSLSRVLSKCRALSTEAVQTGGEKDAIRLFFNEEVQHLLKILTRVDIKKVLRARRDGEKREPPELKFMTNEQLQEALAEAQKKADKLLQMPPVVKPYTETDKVLLKDPALQGYDTVSYVFTDITYGITYKDRLFVVREPNGDLRLAKQAEKKRLNQIYFPLPAREHTVPKMFTGDYFQDLLKRHKYEFILDRACCQFDPDEPEFQRIRNEVYDHVQQEGNYNLLRSTRHFGPMVFLLALNKDIDNLLLDVIQTGNINEAASLVQLYHKLHPTAKSAELPFDGDNIQLITNYASLEAVSKIRILNAIKGYQELEKIKQETAKAIEQSHGNVSSTHDVTSDQ